MRVRCLTVCPLASVVLGLSLAAILPCHAAASDTMTPAASAAELHDGGRDFDIFFGTWRVHHRRLKERLAGSTEWLEFDGTQVMRPILGGRGNMTDNVFNMPDGSVQRGVTLRAFDPKTATWSIWWLDGNDPTKIDVPVVGAFENGTGAFYAQDTFRGRPIKVRFLWLNVTATTRQWEQAFSTDDGKTWETNWVAHFTKVEP